MKSSVAFSILFVFPAIQAATLPRSQHDGMLARNFKNVLQDDIPKPQPVRRTPQGPASNPGEFTNVGLSAVNPQNQGDSSGSGSSSSSSDDYHPEPALDSQAFSSGPVPQHVTTSPVPLPQGTDIPPAPFPFPFPTGGGRHHHHRPTEASTGFVPCPTGRRHQPNYNSTDLWGPDYDVEEPPGVMEVDLEVESDGEVVVEETLWQFNGTGWNHTNIPLPSGSVLGTLVPMPLPTGTGGSGAAGASGVGGEAAGFYNEQMRPGFTGPRERVSVGEMTSHEIAADGTGMEAAGLGGGWMKRWLSGWI